MLVRGCFGVHSTTQSFHSLTFFKKLTYILPILATHRYICNVLFEKESSGPITNFLEMNDK